MKSNSVRGLSIGALIATTLALFVSCGSDDNKAPTSAAAVPVSHVDQPLLPAIAPGVYASTQGLEKPIPERGYALSTSSTLSLSLARNETAGRVLRVSLTGCQTLPVSGAPAGVSVELFHMPAVRTTRPSFQGAHTGFHFDPLVPLATTANQVCPGESYVWMDLAVGKNVDPGNYAFTVGGVTVLLRVWNLTLPDRAAMPLYVGLGSFSLVRGHGLKLTTGVDVQGPLTQQYVELLRAHRIEPQGQFVQNPPLFSDGTLNLDNFSGSGGSFRQLVLQNSLAPVLVRSPGEIGAPWASAQELAGWNKAVASTPELANAWVYITDEPTDLSGTRARAQYVRANAPRLKTMVTHEPRTELLGLIDHFTVVFEFFKQPGHWQDYSKAPDYFLYGSCMSHGSCVNTTVGKLTGTPDLMFDQPSVHGRAFPLVAYALGAKAALYYNATEAFGQLDPWTDQYLFGGNGDGTLVYPGIAGQRGFENHQPVASIRLKALRQGMYDIEYAKLARDAGLEGTPASLVVNQFSWPRSHVDFDNVRQKIGDALGL